MISILFAVVIVGVIVYLVESMIPLPAPIKVVVRVVGVLVIGDPAVAADRRDVAVSSHA